VGVLMNSDHPCCKSWLRVMTWLRTYRSISVGLRMSAHHRVSVLLSCLRDMLASKYLFLVLQATAGHLW
jgi:hypothetical protein